MPDRPETGPPPLIERQVRRVANARSVTIGLALTFVALALVGAIVIRIADPDNFPSFGLAVWWALQTVTTVGYGDIVPTTSLGQFVGAVVMVLGISFIAFLTAGVTSFVVQRGQAGAEEAERLREEKDLQTIVDALAEEIKGAIADLGQTLRQHGVKIGQVNVRVSRSASITTTGIVAARARVRLSSCFLIGPLERSLSSVPAGSHGWRAHYVMEW